MNPRKRNCTFFWQKKLALLCLLSGGGQGAGAQENGVREAGDCDLPVPPLPPPPTIKACR